MAVTRSDPSEVLLSCRFLQVYVAVILNRDSIFCVPDLFGLFLFSFLVF